MTNSLTLRLLPDDLAICRLAEDMPFPDWLPVTGFMAFIRAPGELTLVCAEKYLPEGVVSEPGWRALGVVEKLDFSQVGVLASLASPLARAGVSIYVISTYDTDYILVREANLEQARAALLEAGHRIQGM